MKKINFMRLLLAAGCWLGAAYAAYDVYTVYANRGVLGTQLLWFWLLLWAGLLLAVGGRWLNVAQPNRVVGASVLSGVLLSAGFMKLVTFPLLFVGFVPLLWAEQEVARRQEGTDTWAMFRLSFTAFFIWNLLSTWWIQNSSLPGGLVGNVLNTIFMCLPMLLYHTTKHHMGQRAGSLGFIAFWLTFEIGHLNWDLSWPWLTLGNGFAQVPALVQWYAITGVFGGSLWILWGNQLVANRLLGWGGQRDWRRFSYWVQPLSLLLLPIAASLVLYYTHDASEGPSIEVVAIQPNYEPHYQKFDTPQQQQLRQFLSLSRKGVTDQTAYLVYPETSFRGGIEAEHPEEAPIVQQLQAYVDTRPGLQLITGISARTIYEENEPRPAHVFMYCNADQTKCRYVDSHNAAIQLSAGATEIPYYQKSKLVPGAESMPFIGGVSFFRSLVLDLGGVPGVGLGVQAEREVFGSERGTVGSLICYESIFGDYVTDYTRLGAEALFVITNDGWWGNTLGHRQHHYLATLRAIENRRYVVRSANTGISSFINSRGDTYRQTAYNEPAALRDDIHLRTDQTFYVRYGDLIGRVSILMSLWLLVSMAANRLRRPKDPTVLS